MGGKILEELKEIKNLLLKILKNQERILKKMTPEDIMIMILLFEVFTDVIYSYMFCRKILIKIFYPAAKIHAASFRIISVIPRMLCVQIMHIGPFDEEPRSVAKMDQFLERNGYRNDFTDGRLHHEICLSDARRVAPERWTRLKCLRMPSLIHFILLMAADGL